MHDQQRKTLIMRTRRAFLKDPPVEELHSSGCRAPGILCEIRDDDDLVVRVPRLPLLRKVAGQAASCMVEAGAAAAASLGAIRNRQRQRCSRLRQK
jgi:hypothetical protein